MRFIRYPRFIPLAQYDAAIDRMVRQLKQQSGIEAIFQIEAIPSLLQIGQFMPLLGETTIEAFDEFVRIRLADSDKELNTELVDDLTIKQGDGKIVE